MLVTNSWTLRKRLIALVICTLLPVAILATIGLLFLADQQRQQNRLQMPATARAIMAAVDGEIENSIAALQVLGYTHPHPDPRTRKRSARHRAGRTSQLTAF